MTTGTVQDQDGRPRLDGMQKVARVVLTALLWAATWMTWMYGGYVVAWLSGAPWENALSFTGNGDQWKYGVLPGLTNILGAILFVVLWGWLASLVDYRWRDGILVVVPFLGQFLTAKWLYRLCAFQVKDWPPAPAVYAIPPWEARLRRVVVRVRRLTPW